MLKNWQQGIKAIKIVKKKLCLAFLWESILLRKWQREENGLSSGSASFVKSCEDAETISFPNLSFQICEKPTIVMLKWAVFPKPAEFRRRIVVRHSFSVFKWCILFRESWASKWHPILKMISAFILYLKYAKDTAMLNEMSDPTKIRNPSTKDDSSLFAIMGWLLFSLLSAGSSSWQFFEAVTISRAHLNRLVDKGAVLLVSMTICFLGNHHL